MKPVNPLAALDAMKIDTKRLSEAVKHFVACLDRRGDGENAEDGRRDKRKADSIRRTAEHGDQGA